MMSYYQIVREVGKGGMGRVYAAKGPSGERVALKMMSAKAASHPDYREMFEHEVKALKKLSHPSIVKILGEPYSDEGGNLFLPMEYVDGKNLAQIVAEKGRFTEEETLRVFTELLDVFSYIHDRACIHRDVKPSNIMIRDNGSVCVIDFGIAKDSKTSTGKTIGRIVGTDGYMSPEQANGYNIDMRTDIYSLGCLLHFMLTGLHAIPKKSNDYETVCAILESSFPRVSDTGVQVSDRTQNAILRAVDKNMTKRFQTAIEFKDALLGYSSSEAYKVSVGRANCDVTMVGEYVSGHHLDIICETSGDEIIKIKVLDHSTNGTGMNGRKLHHDSYTFMVNQSINGLLNNSSQLPDVLIAGLPNYNLDWTAVLRVVQERVGSYPPPPPPPQVTTEKLSWIIGILCFLSPIVGWVLGAVWKKEHPQKAQKANKLALYGFIFNIILSGVFRIIEL